MKSVQIRSFFWSVFSCIQSEYGKIRTRKNSVFGHFSCSANTLNTVQKLFFNKVILDGFLGKTKYYVIRVEYQVRGSLHLHCLPGKNKHSDVHELVKLYQFHKHCEACHKYKNQACRFHVGKFVLKYSMVTKPFSLNILENINLTGLDK